MSLTALAIHKPIATTMAYLIVVVVGLVSFRYLPVDLLPPIESPELTIIVNYPNVGPEEMERIVTEPVENAIAGVPFLEDVTSSSAEGVSRVRLRFTRGANLDEAANDLRAALDRVRGQLPREIDAPMIYKFDPNDFPILTVAARGSLSHEALTVVLERDIAKQLEQVPGVGAIDIWGGIYREVQVDLFRDRMVSSDLSTQDILAAIARDNVTLPVGNLRGGIGSYYVRTSGQFRTPDEVANTVISLVGEKPLRIGDVATVRMGYEDIERYVELDGAPTVNLDIRKQAGANTVAVSAAVHQTVERINATHSDLHLQVITDQSEYIQNSITNLRNSAIWGGMLAILVLLAFLRNGSVTLVITTAIPISIVATFALLYFNALTLNQMSFGAIALAVGLIVDNAIVVLENIIRQRQQGADLPTSAQRGTSQVIGAVIASTLTTSIIFLPVVFMRTVTGAMFQELALVVVFALLCSLLVAITLVPMLASRVLTIKPETTPSSTRLSRLENVYGRCLAIALRHRRSALIAAALATTVAALALPLIPFELTPETDGGEIQVRLRLDDGSNIAVLHDYSERLGRAVREIVPAGEALHIIHDVRADRVVIRVVMKSVSERSISSVALADQIRAHVRERIPGAELQVAARSGLSVLRRTFGSGNSEGAAVEIQLRGDDLLAGELLANDLMERMRGVPGIADVSNTAGEQRPMQDLLLDRERLAYLGLDVQRVAATLQTNVGGSQAGTFRLAGDEIPIMVRLRPEDREVLMDLDNIALATDTGGVLAAATVLNRSESRGPANINRVDGQRVSYLSASLEQGAALGDVISALRQTLAQQPLPPGFSLYYGGEYEEQQQTQRDFRVAIALALVLIYMVLAAQFERLLDPLIVMFSVPLIVIGVVPTMLLTGTTLNVQSLMGVVMLIGIVVNNAIVLVDYINLLRRENHDEPLAEVVILACRSRLRPIMMTTATTMLALLPLSFGLGDGGEVQAALARVVIGGLTASTLITLVLVPAVYMLCHDSAPRPRRARALLQVLGIPFKA